MYLYLLAIVSPGRIPVQQLFLDQAKSVYNKESVLSSRYLYIISVNLFTSSFKICHYANTPVHIPSFKTSLFENSFSVSAARLWNTVPLDIRMASSLEAFKHSIKNHLLAF